MATIMMAGGGSGGHVVPLVAVARELASRGHQCIFVGTRNGFEAKLVPPAGFPLEFIEIGGLKRVGLTRTVRTLVQLPLSVRKVFRLLAEHRPSAVFSMGGYAAGPVVLAALAKRIPLIVMEPNAMPGITNRQIGRFVTRALLSFPEAARFFPRGKSEVTGLPVRAEFFAIPPKPREATAQRSDHRRKPGIAHAQSSRRRKLALLPRESNAGAIDPPDRLGSARSLASKFAEAGIDGEVVPFIDDDAFRIRASRPGGLSGRSRHGRGTGSGGKAVHSGSASHSRRSASAPQCRSVRQAGAARLVLDAQMDGGRFFEEVARLQPQPGVLKHMGEQARTFAHPGAARRAADVVEESIASLRH